ncbi:MAG: HlyD family secretion protein [Pseudomonadota bacterium]|nr:HlyD family secretion protein [Pseudomonadota bacterium]
MSENPENKEANETVSSDSNKPEYSKASPTRSWRSRTFIRLILMVLGPIAVVITGGYYYVIGGRYVSTENAYVKADKIAISTNIPGRVIDVLVSENDKVNAGQLLFRLNPVPYQIALDRATAKLEAIKTEIHELQAVYRQKQAELKIQQSDLAYFQSEFNRQVKLKKRGVVSQSRLDEARRNVNSTKQRILAIRQEISRALARLGGDLRRQIDEHPLVQETLAERERAALRLSWTRVRAPDTGIVTNISLEPGEFVKKGTPIFSVVGTDDIWVEANLKETDLTHVKVGQDTTIQVDSYPDHVWRAKVQSISMATGAEFSLLPPQNATGNWVKVVQRIPIKFKLLDSPYEPPLRAGMSVVVEIDTLYKRELPSFIKNALAWVQ